LAHTIFNSAYFFIKHKGLAQTFSDPPIFSSSAKVWRKHFQKAPKTFHQNFFQACQHFSSVCFIAQRKDMQEFKCNIRTKRKGVKAKISKQSKSKRSCVFLSSSRKIPL
jgi:hypothetical protein